MPLLATHTHEFKDGRMWNAHALGSWDQSLPDSNAHYPCYLGLSLCAEPVFLHLRNGVISTLPVYSIELFLTAK